MYVSSSKLYYICSVLSHAPSWTQSDSSCRTIITTPSTCRCYRMCCRGRYDSRVDSQEGCEYVSRARVSVRVSDWDGTGGDGLWVPEVEALAGDRMGLILKCACGQGAVEVLRSHGAKDRTGKLRSGRVTCQLVSRAQPISQSVKIGPTRSTSVTIGRWSKRGFPCLWWSCHQTCVNKVIWPLWSL